MKLESQTGWIIIKNGARAREREMKLTHFVGDLRPTASKRAMRRLFAAAAGRLSMFAVRPCVCSDDLSHQWS